MPDVSIVLGVDGEREFRNAIQNINSQINNFDSEMKALVSGFDSLVDAESSASQRLDILGRSIDAQKQKITTLSAQYDRQVAKLRELQTAVEKAASAEYSSQAEKETAITKTNNAYNRQASVVNKLSAQINQATAALNSMEKEFRAVEQGSDSVTKSFKNVEDGAADMGGSLRDAFAGGAVAGGIQSLASSLSGLVDETMEYRKIMASLNASSAKAGYTVEQTSASYQQLYEVLGDEQTAATALANLQALGLSQADLIKLTDAAIGAWATYGDSIPIDGLAEAINETIRAGAVTGTFADVLNWAGTSEDKFNEKLAKCKTESERVNLVMQELAKQGLADTAQAWRENNQDIVKTNQASAEMTETWAQLAKKASPVFAEIKTSIAEAALGVMEFAEQNKGLVATAGAAAGAAAGFSVVATAVKKVTETLKVFGITLSANPIFLLAGVITGAAVAIGVLDKAAENADPEMAALRDRTEELTSSADALTSSWQTMTDASKQQAESRIAEINQAQQLTKELKGLVDANGKVAASDQERAAGLYEIVNNLMPGLVQKTGEGEAANYEFAESIDAVIEKEKALALVEAYKDDYAEAIKTKAEAQKNLNDALAQQYDLDIKIQQAMAAADYNKAADLQKQQAAIKETVEAQSDLIASTEGVTQSYEAMVSAIASGNYEEALSVAQNFGVNLSDISKMSANEIKAAYGDINNAIKMVEEYLNSGSLTEAQRAQFTSILNELTVQKAQYEDQMLQTAVDGARSFAGGLSSEEPAVESTTKSVADASVAALNIAQAALEKGQDGGESYATGVASANGKSETSGRNLAQAAIDAAAAKKAGMVTTGKNLGEGLATGILNSINLVVSAANRVAQAAMNKMRAAENFNEHSPSKWAEETGRFVDEGLANGLIGGIGMVAASIDKLSKVSKETIKNNFTDITSNVLNTAELLNDKLVAKEEELAKRLEETGLDEATKESLNAQLSAVKEFRSEYEKALQDIQQSQESMADKLREYGDLFETVKTETGAFIELGDLQADIDAINRYGNALESLKDRGVSDSLLNEITGMNVDDALAYTDQLLGMTDEQYEKYMSLWEEKQKAADEVARKFYQDEMTALTEEFTDKLPEELSDIKDDMRSVGVNSIQGMIDGIKSMSGTLANAARQVVANAIAAMRMEADIHSPSKKTENLIGVPMAEGVEVGFWDYMDNLKRTMANAVMAPVKTITRADLYGATAGMVNGMAAVGASTGATQPIIIQVNLSNKQIAEVLYDPLKQVGKQRGY